MTIKAKSITRAALMTYIWKISTRKMERAAEEVEANTAPTICSSPPATGIATV